METKFMFMSVIKVHVGYIIGKTSRYAALNDKILHWEDKTTK